MNRPTQLILSLAFVAVLSAPLVGYLAGARPVMLDNRSRTDFPELSAAGMVDAQTYETVAAYFTDRLPMRDRAIRIERALDEAIALTDPVQEGVPRGRNGWLFHHDTLLDECPTDDDPAELARYVDDVVRQAEALGFDVRVLVSPDKASVYTQHLPLEGVGGLAGLANPEESPCGRYWRSSIDRAATSRPELLPLVEPMIAESDDPDDPTYWKRDTHWTDRGALVQAEVLMESLQPGIWDPNEVVVANDRTRVGDLARMRGLTGPQQTPGYDLDRPGLTIETETVGEGDPNETIALSWASSDEVSVVEGTTLWVGDSFNRQSLPWVQPYFEELIFINWQYLNDHDFEEIIDDLPDTVIISHVQRNMMKGRYRTTIGGFLDYLEERQEQGDAVNGGR